MDNEDLEDNSYNGILLSDNKESNLPICENIRDTLSEINQRKTTYDLIYTWSLKGKTNEQT